MTTKIKALLFIVLLCSQQLLGCLATTDHCRLYKPRFMETPGPRIVFDEDVSIHREVIRLNLKSVYRPALNKSILGKFQSAGVLPFYNQVLQNVENDLSEAVNKSLKSLNYFETQNSQTDQHNIVKRGAPLIPIALIGLGFILEHAFVSYKMDSILNQMSANIVRGDLSVLIAMNFAHYKELALAVLDKILSSQHLNLKDYYAIIGKKFDVVYNNAELVQMKSSNVHIENGLLHATLEIIAIPQDKMHQSFTIRDLGQIVNTSLSRLNIPKFEIDGETGRIPIDGKQCANIDFDIISCPESAVVYETQCSRLNVAACQESFKNLQNNSYFRSVSCANEVAVVSTDKTYTIYKTKEGQKQIDQEGSMDPSGLLFVELEFGRELHIAGNVFRGQSNNTNIQAIPNVGPLLPSNQNELTNLATVVADLKRNIDSNQSIWLIWDSIVNYIFNFVWWAGADVRKWVALGLGLLFAAILLCVALILICFAGWSLFKWAVVFLVQKALSGAKFLFACCTTEMTRSKRQKRLSKNRVCEKESRHDAHQSSDFEYLPKRQYNNAAWSSRSENITFGHNERIRHVAQKNLQSDIEKAQHMIDIEESRYDV